MDVTSQTMKRVAVVYDFLSELGGLERVMAVLSRVIKQSVVDFVFLSVDKKAQKKFEQTYLVDPLPAILEVGPSIGSSQFKIGFSFLRGLFGHGPFASLSADLFFSNSFICSYLCYKLKRLKGIPYVVYMQHPPNFLYQRTLAWVNNLSRLVAYAAGFFFSPFLRALDKTAVQHADLVFVNSEYTSHRIQKIYGIRPPILYPPVSSLFKPMPQQQAKTILQHQGIKRKFVLLHGRIIPDKRPDLALRAFALTKDVDLVVSGTIEQQTALLRLASELGIRERVIFLGRVSEQELVALYTLAECFIMSAPKEDFGLTPVEAMACGTPVVAFNRGSVSEIVIDTKNGFVVEVSEGVDGFINKLSKLSQISSEECRKDAVTRFSKSRMADDYEKLYNEVIIR